MNEKVAIKLENVSKLFRKQKQKTFKEFLPALLGRKSTSETFWALKDLNLEIKRGETFGIIGPNGSGKSTLLKLIAGVTEPTEGEIQINGRIAPLIELGAGFHPELTGRENVFLNGVILGLKRDEIKKKFKKIVDFAGLWDFIDQPIKHYSSGMYLRLAFSVAVHTEPDILLVDEILAVGDERFQKKCFRKMRQFKKACVTIVYVTHNLASAKDFCDRAMWLEKGLVKELGSSKLVINHYQAKQ